MNEQDLKQWNDKISYNEGKIYFEINKGYTSNLIKRLVKQGYYICKSGAMTYLKDSKQNTVTQGAHKMELLFNTAKIFV